MTKPSDCPHRKQELRTETCPGCRGNVQIKVFQCDQHGECTIAKQIPGVHLCSASVVQRKSELVHIPPNANVSTTRCGIIMQGIKRETAVAKVQLDGGEIVEAANERQIRKDRGKRCVVGKDGERFVLMM